MNQVVYKNNEAEIPQTFPERKAAIYARMSTEHQKYSIENQEAAMNDYAAANNLKISTKYIDDGKSGLTIESRDALTKLIFDIQNKVVTKNDFEVILVLDVSRWGRFQNSDESAYYEYICYKSGFEVHYVAEAFKNDGSMMSNLMKSFKRTMAGEYSRELSNKVFAGQCRLIEKGYKQGGTAGFGLKRTLIDEHGNYKGDLKYLEHKSIQTDRVILTPGEAEEIETVKWMYLIFQSYCELS